jgi:hypothetical protein
MQFQIGTRMGWWIRTHDGKLLYAMVRTRVSSSKSDSCCNDNNAKVRRFQKNSRESGEYHYLLFYFNIK